MLKILILVSSIHVGDSAQAEAILKAFNANNQIIESYQIDAKQDLEIAKNEYLAKVKRISTQEKYITLAVGEEGMKLLGYLAQNNAIDDTRSYTCLSIHQYFSKLENLKLDHIIIPEATIDNKDEKKVISQIPNVTFIFAPLGSHPAEGELKTAYDDWSNKPELNKKYIIVMLAGDAPDASNNIKYFTKDSAKKLFNYIYKLWKDRGQQHKIIVENGPRTGKYDPLTGEISSMHEYKLGQTPEQAVDDISHYFIQLLKEFKMSYQFFNFAIEVDDNKRKTISYHNPLLYLAEQPDNLFILPGASVSLMGQMPLYLTSDKIILFKPSSMNEDHEMVANLAYKRNYLSYFNDNGEVIKPAKITKRDKDDSSLVIKDILKGYKNKFGL